MSEAINIYFGKDMDGKPVITDLTKHCLIGGTTSSGKSTLIHLHICQLLLKYSPLRLELYICDPKRTEMQDYYFAPQTRMLANGSDGGNPVVDCEIMLQRLCKIMDERYEWLSKRGIKNARETQMSKILLIIDELADVVLDPFCGGRITRSIDRLASLGLASGIHLLLATQHPLSNIVRSTIKANCACRVCLKVMTKSNSYVILDRSGGEKLHGNGHMLVLDPADSQLREVQAPYVSTNQIRSQIRASIRKYGQRQESGVRESM